MRKGEHKRWDLPDEAPDLEAAPPEPRGFRVGDRVRVVSFNPDDNPDQMNDDLDQELVGVVTEVSRHHAQVQGDSWRRGGWCFSFRQLELLED